MKDNYFLKVLSDLKSKDQKPPLRAAELKKLEELLKSEQLKTAQEKLNQFLQERIQFLEEVRRACEKSKSQSEVYEKCKEVTLVEDPTLELKVKSDLEKLLETIAQDSSSEDAPINKKGAERLELAPKSHSINR